MKIRKAVAALLLTAVLSVATACGTTTDSASSTSSTSSTSTTDTGTAQEASGGRGGPGAVHVSSATTQAELIALIQEAYGDGDLDLHRGHQPVQDVLDEVLGISHDELHVRMDAGQNLAAVATDLGIDPQTLIDAMVESWSPAIDNVLASGDISEDEAAQYEEALEEAFSFRVNWDGEQAMPTFSGPSA